MEEGDFFTYQTDVYIKNELVSLVEWIKNNPDNKTSEELVNDYLTENDIAFTGDLRKMEKISERNVLREAIVMIVTVLGAVAFVILMFYLMHNAFANTPVNLSK